LNKRVLVAGSGGIGRAVGLLLRELGELDVDLVLGDADPKQAETAAQFVNGGDGGGEIDTMDIPFEGMTDDLEDALNASDIVLDCLPGGQAPRVATWAMRYGLHYVNLTEYVAETAQILKMAKEADTGFALQAGLAPGFINVLGNRLYQQFREAYGVDKIDVMKMRVGALTRNAEAPHFYGFTWSPIGVATEYVKPAEVVRDYKKIDVPSLEQIETLLIDGVAYEEATTSGGAADMPEALAGLARNLDYKTLRWPGHWSWVKEQIADIGDVPHRIGILEARMLSRIPRMEDDLVVIYAAVEGEGADGCRHRIDRAYKVYPGVFGGQTLKAIQSTTAAGMAECAHLLLTTGVKGPLLQSQLDPVAYLNGPYVGEVYGQALSSKRG